MNSAAPTRSTFVTVVAWIFLLLSGFGLAISLLQNLMIHLLFPPDAFEALAEGPLPPGMPPAAGWFLAHIRWVFALVLLPTVAVFVASLGLLRRREWGRRLFIAMMVFSIVLGFASLLFQGAMLVGMDEHFAQLAQHAPDHQPTPDPRLFLIGIGVFMLLYATGVAAIQAWIIKRLMSPAIVAEFAAAG